MNSLTFSCVVSVWIFLISLTQQAEDCQYNKCTFPTGPIKHVPCKGLGSRELIRSVNCVDGSLWHICCLSKRRTDIQKSRQEWFRRVTQFGTTTGPNCMKRILCEQSCKDGLSSVARSDYPEVLESDNEENKDYVQAYAEGENLSCYGLTKNSSINSLESCEYSCNTKYLECEADMQNSLSTQGIYKLSRASHKLGMFSFSAIWWMDDKVKDGYEWTANKVKTKFNELLDHMNQLEQELIEHVKHLIHRGKRSLTEGNEFEQKLESNWNDFLIKYNETDSKLVEILVDQVTYPKFKYYRNVTEEILTTYDFEGNFPNSGYSAKTNTVLFTITPFLIYALSL